MGRGRGRGSGRNRGSGRAVHLFSLLLRVRFRIIGFFPGCSSPGRLSASPRMLQSRGRRFLFSRPPGCSSPGVAILVLGHAPNVRAQGCWLAPRIFQSSGPGRYLASWPPSVRRSPGCSSPGGRFLASWPRPGCSSPGPLWLIMWSSLLRSAAPRMLQSRGRFILSSRGSGRGWGFFGRG